MARKIRCESWLYFWMLENRVITLTFLFKHILSLLLRSVWAISCELLHQKGAALCLEVLMLCQQSCHWTSHLRCLCKMYLHYKSWVLEMNSNFTTTKVKHWWHYIHESLNWTTTHCRQPGINEVTFEVFPSVRDVSPCPIILAAWISA